MSDCRTTAKAVGEDSDYVQLDPDSLAPTVLASGPAVFHYAELRPDGRGPRCLNVREAAALQSFPCDYQFTGTTSAKYKQAGNAVPVCFAAAIARSVRASLRLVYEEELTAAAATNEDSEESEGGDPMGS
jgi:site-specific DNA-cytosine methylase